MNSIIGLGRYLFAIPMAIIGIFHLMHADGMTSMVPLPGGNIWVYLTGAALILSAVSIMLGKYDKLACVLLAVMLLIFVFALHMPAAMGSDAAAAQGGSMAALKDTALAGAALMCAAMARDHSVIG